MVNTSVRQVLRKQSLALSAVCITLLVFTFSACAHAQGDNWLQPVAAFPLATPAQVGGLSIHQRSATSQPFTVAGACGAFVGQGDGRFEAWAWPVKLLRDFHISAELDGYPVPIDVNEQSSEITVQPDRTTITFSHAAFTVREILFATPCTAPSATGAGVAALFQISSTRPLTLTFSMEPEVERMWPAPNYNRPTPEWVKLPAGGGYYVLHTDADDLTGGIAMPGTEPGILQPYQERPKQYPLQMVLHYDPQRDSDHYFPLLLAGGSYDAKQIAARLQQMGSEVQQAYEGTAQYWENFFKTRVSADTPDPRINQALGWAEVSIDQLRVRHESQQYGDELALVAGLYNSGDSNRPGFGWFFGRDSLYTLFAVDSYGDWGLVRHELDFLLKRQRSDGKIMHEYSQTAELTDWTHLPYEYAAADSTPLMLMALRDYAMRSGDVAYVQQHWSQIALAWNFERTHDTDGDGIYDNAQGTGWVESWPPGMPHQEIYLAALDEQASQAYADLAKLAGKPNDEADARAQKIAATILREYQPAAAADGNARDGMYAFSYNGIGKLDTTATIYPSVAWWQGTYALPGANRMFSRWASSEFSTDWGTRDLGEHETLYDPMSYHQGSVWPLFTGWASLAEYRTDRPLAGYQHLMQDLNLTWAQDLGAATELLSGRFFEPLGRSTTHQLWSSAMVLTPALRGLFGVDYNAATDTLSIHPQLPATWPGATLRHVPVGADRRVSVFYQREGATLSIRVEGEDGGKAPKLAGPSGSSFSENTLRVPLPGAEIELPAQLPLPGAETAQLKVLEEHHDAHSATWVLEGNGGSVYRLPLRLNGIPSAQAEGGQILDGAPALAAMPLEGNALLAATPRSESASGDAVTSVATATQKKSGPSAGKTLQVTFKNASGYATQTVSVHW